MSGGPYFHPVLGPFKNFFPREGCEVQRRLSVDLDCFGVHSLLSQLVVPVIELNDFGCLLLIN